MIDLRANFIFWYHEEFKQSELYTNMEKTVEDSPWHRERNVAIHTDMVVSQYIGFIENNVWSTEDVLGALACAFHDVGKPAAMEVCYREDRGEYRKFHGHEVVSARLWEDYAMTNWKTLAKYFDLALRDIYRVGWLCEKHLPFGIKNQQKRLNLALTVRKLFPYNQHWIFNTVLMSDAFGRISDDMKTKRMNVRAWTNEFMHLMGNLPKSKS